MGERKWQRKTGGVRWWNLEKAAGRDQNTRKKRPGLTLGRSMRGTLDA